MPADGSPRCLKREKAMKGRNIGRRTFGIFVGTIAACTIGASVFQKSFGQNEPESAGHILPRNVTAQNVAFFEEQVRKDIPIGTPASDVVDYLNFWKIKNEFHIQDRTVSKNTILAVLEDLGRSGPFRASLAMYFELVENKVASIRFRIEYL